jgi:hypothetical protein
MPKDLSTATNLARLLRLNFEVLDAQADRRIRDRRFSYFDGVAVKLFYHSVTAYRLFGGSTRVDVPSLADLQLNFIDWPSLQVIARACTETYIAFHFVFVQPAKDRDLAEFRYNAWMLAGFRRRELTPAWGSEAVSQLGRDKKSIAGHRRRIQKTDAFSRLGNRDQDAVLKGLNWHPRVSLSAICDGVFGPTWGRPLYMFMSSHAHTDGLSAVQVHDVATDLQKQRRMGESALYTIAVVLARLTKDMASMWVKSRKVYANHLYRDLNEVYATFGEADPASFLKELEDD